ncbi:hypothetical protein M427DRAFT_411717 [Gonapodya prolifera JEL478]|uniref:F-box domain-containing protein n=1 Tax=Gonapodya prolifera (strain JEL478) TaxID=1344416 RepID=A0A139A5B1_GONPJ|nr:hypothetical protein M427DRAFT_411717 [Gonapodya prolifera JEL478]|eukprot:KXS11980.1 hypothetical protein M427DRAFT_411717 [Gonapodya prolifera JEL478]
MELLPVEILQAIFRFLPPKDFYSKISVICRSFRDAARNAIPGCSGGKVGVCCWIRVTNGVLDEYHRQSYWFTARFKAVHYGGVEVWTSMTGISERIDFCAIRVTEGGDLVRGVENVLLKRLERRFQTNIALAVEGLQYS